MAQNGVVCNHYLANDPVITMKLIGNAKAEPGVKPHSAWSLATLTLTVAAATGLLFLATGCKSVPNDPPSPQAGFGYLDFYAEQEPGTLSWDIQRYDATTKHFHLLFSEIKAAPSRVVRVAISPGEHRVRVGFLNQPINAPAELDVSVRSGMVTPVKVELTEGETRTYRVREQRYGPTARGHVGRVTETRTMQGKGIGVTAEAMGPLDYQPSASMPYAKTPAS